MKYFILYFFTLSILSIIACSNTQDENTVIKINDRIVSIEEFTNRLNNIPQTLKISDSELKENLLSTLIAEKILADQAVNERLDTVERVKMLSEEYVNEILYEKWMENEIQNKVSVSEDEIKNAYPKFIEDRIVEYWVIPSEAEGIKLKDEITAGNLSELKSQTKKIVFTEALENIEEAVYKLEEGKLSSPVKVDSSYYVFKLLKREPVKEYEQYSFNDLKPEIEKRIRTRKQNYLADETLAELMQGKEFSIERESYNFLVQQLYQTIYSENKLKHSSPELIQLEVFLKEVNPSDQFNKILVHFNDGDEWSVIDFWKMLSVSPFPLNYKNPADLQSGLFDILRRIVLLKTIAKNAKDKNFNNDPKLISESGMWTSNALAQSFISTERKKIEVDENEVLDFYDSTKFNFMKPAMRKILPIIVDNKNLVQSLFKRLLNNEDIISIGRKYSLNKVPFNSDQPGIFISENMWGDIGKKVFSMNIGEISDPIPGLDSTYAIIKLIEIRESLPYPYIEIRGKLITLLEDMKLQKKIDEFLLKMIDDYNITINRDVFNNAEYYGGNMGVKKTHFPLRGAVPGFPLFDHKSEWYRKAIGSN